MTAVKVLIFFNAGAATVVDVQGQPAADRLAASGQSLAAWPAIWWDNEAGPYGLEQYGLLMFIGDAEFDSGGNDNVSWNSWRALTTGEWQDMEAQTSPF